MKKMNTKQIEEVARLHLTNYYVDCGDRLDIKCASNDKTMSYDGSITLFDENENNEELSKKKYRIQIPIQLKGKSVEKFKYKNFKYSVTIEDLKIYSKDFKGILFLVVQICKKEQKLFYNILSPYKVRKILEKGQGQKTISLEFAYAGDDKKRLISICEEFECRVKKEIKASYIKMKDIKDTYPVQFTVSSMTSIFQIFKEIKNYDTPFYVTKNGQNYIIEDLDKIDSLTQYDNNRVFLNGELLWDCVKKEIDQNNNYKLYFGENVILDLTNDKVNNNDLIPIPVKYTLNSTIDENIKIIKFINFMENNKNIEFKKNNQDLHFYGDATTFLNKELESKYKNLINLKNFFEYLHISYSFEFKDLNKNEIDALINISNIFEIKKGNIKNGLYFVNIGEKRIFIDIYNYKDELVILNPFEENGIFKIYLETRNEKIETSSVVLIKDDLTNILNFDLNYYKKVILELVKEECLDEIDSLILNLITAFDKTKEIRYLKCTEEIYLEIMKISDNVNYYINLMQCYKRERELNNEEIGKLMNIYSNLTDTQEDIMRKFCIDVILENKGNSLLYYKKMDEEAKEFMNKLPIINLYNIQNKFN